MADNPEQTSIPTLHHLNSSQSHRVLWALEELSGANGLNYHLINYSREDGLAPKSLKSIFPLGKSPILTVEPAQDSSESNKSQEKEVLTESRLILQFISDNYAKGIWDPVSPKDQKRNTFFQEFANNTLAVKVDFALLFDVIPEKLPFPFRQLARLLVKPVVSFWMNELQPIFRFLEDELSEEAPWFGGEKLGLADFCMSWGMDLASQRGYFDAKKYPKVAKWHNTIIQRPAYQKAVEKGGSYNLVTFD